MVDAADLTYKQFWSFAGKYGWEPKDQDSLAQVMARPLQKGQIQADLQHNLTQSIYQQTGGLKTPFSPPEDIQNALTTQVMAQSWGNISKKIAVASPEGSVYLAFNSPTEAMQKAYSMAFDYLSEIYGDQYTAAYLQAALINNPDQHKATMDVLNRIVSYQAPGTYAVSEQGSTPQDAMANWNNYVANVSAERNMRADPTATATPDLLYEVLTNPDKWNELTPNQKLALKGYTYQVLPALKSMQGGARKDSNTFEQVAAIIGTEKGPSIALSRSEIKQLANLMIGDANTPMNLSGPAAPGEQVVKGAENLGIISVSARGDSGTVRIDQEWAQANPVKATAVMRQLMINFPGVQFTFGESGILGDAMDLLGMPVDFVGGALAGGVQYLSENTIERWTTSDEDRQKAAMQAARIRRDLAKGRIKEEDIPDMQRQLYRLDDLANGPSFNPADDFGQAMMKSLTGDVSGLGFTEPLLAAVDYRPGDPGYDAVAALTTIAGLIYLDPLNWAPAVLRGIKYAETIPLVDGATEVVRSRSRSLLTRQVYSMLAQTPEEMWNSPIGRTAVERLWDAKGAMSDAEFGARVAKHLGLDAETTQMLVRATTKDELDSALLYISTGRGYDWKDSGNILSRLNDVTAELDDLKGLPGKVRSLRQRAAALKGQQTRMVKTQQLIADSSFKPTLDYHTAVVEPEQMSVVVPVDEPITPEQFADFRTEFQNQWMVDEGRLRQQLLDSGYPEDQIDAEIAQFTQESSASAQDFGGIFDMMEQYVGRQNESALTWGDVFNWMLGGDPHQPVLSGLHPQEWLPFDNTSAMEFIDNLASAPRVTTDSTPLRVTRFPDLQNTAGTIATNDPELISAYSRGRGISGTEGYLDVNPEELFQSDRVYNHEEITYIANAAGAVGEEEASQALFDLAAEIADRGLPGVSGERILEDITGELLIKYLDEGGATGEYVDDIFKQAGYKVMARQQVNGDGLNYYRILDDSVFKTNIEDLRTTVRPGTPTEAGPAVINPVIQGRLDDLELRRTEALDQMRDTADRLARSKEREDDLIAEYAYLRSVHEGRQFQSMTPLMHPPSKGVLAQILPKGPFENGYLKAVELVDKFPNNLFQSIGAKKLANFLFTKEGREMEKTAKEFLGGRMRFIVNDAGTGETIVFPSTTLSDRVALRLGVKPEELTVNLAQKSYDSLFNFTRRLGHSEETAMSMLAGWADIKSKNQAFEWYVNWYKRAIMESPVLPYQAKLELMDIWPELVGERAAGYITSIKGGVADFRATNFRLAEDPLHPGAFVRTPVPSFTGDMLQSVKLPTAEALQNYLSFTRRMLADWVEHGGAARKLAGSAATWWHRTWTWINTEWKYLVLIGRMPTALPLRIVSEEMIRMAAYDYASAVHHPFEWFKSVKGADEFGLFAESPVGLLGTISNRYEEAGNLRLAREGRQTVQIGDGQHFFNSLAGMLARRFKYASPETPELLTKSPEKFLAWLETDAGRAKLPGFLEHMDDVLSSGGVKSRVEYVQNMQTELKQYIGTGEGATKVKGALFTGRMTTPEGKVVEVGTEEFANELKRMFDANEWVPGSTYLPRFAGDYLPTSRGSVVDIFVPFKDTLFEWMYSKPDLYFARSPLYRQIAIREYKALKGIGYSDRAAKDVAKYRAAERTASLMFTIGAHTPAEFALRNISPFFPAWRELATTWLYRVPRFLGGGNALIGAPILAHRADMWVKFFQSMGILRQDTNGAWVVPIPGLGLVLQHLFGSEIPGKAFANAESMAGLLPIPTPDKGLQGVFPTLGGPSGFALAKLNQLIGGSLDDVETAFTLFGGDTSLGPAALDRLMEAFGVTPPWMSNATHDYHDAVRNWAVIDGIQIYMMNHPAPQMPMGEKVSAAAQQKYLEDWQAWTQEALDAGEHYAFRSYLTRALSGAIMPFSVNWTPEVEQRLRAVQQVLASAPDDLSSPFLDTFKANYPGAWGMLTSKTINLADTGGISRQDFTQFREDMRNGQVDAMSPEEWMRFSYGMNSYFVYLNKRSDLYKALGDDPRTVLLSGFEKQRQLAELDRDWQNFLDMTVVVAEQEGGGRAFGGDNGLFAEWEKSRYGTDAPSLSLEQQRAIEAKKLLGELGVSLSPNRADADFKTMSRKLSEVIGDPGYPAPTTEVGKAINWWWDNVGDPYLSRVDNVWEQINQTPGALRGPLYQRLAEIDNAFYHDTPSRFGSLPSPQEVFFENMSPQDQRRRLIEEAALPPWFLSAFYRDKLGYKGDEGKMNQLASFINSSDEELKFRVAQSGISTSSTAYDNLKAQYEAQKTAKAKELGLEDVYRQWQEPTYARIDRALRLSTVSSTWAMLKTEADRIWATVAGHGHDPGGSSTEAMYYQRLFVQKVEQARQDDITFDKLMSTFEQAMGDNGQALVGPDLYMKLFFDYFGDSAPAYIYTR